MIDVAYIVRFLHARLLLAQLLLLPLALHASLFLGHALLVVAAVAAVGAQAAAQRLGEYLAGDACQNAAGAAQIDQGQWDAEQGVGDGHDAAESRAGCDVAITCRGNRERKC